MSLFFLFYKNYVNQQLQQNQYAALTRNCTSLKVSLTATKKSSCSSESLSSSESIVRSPL